MCGRTVMVVVGRNIPVTLIDMEKVKEKILILPFVMFCVWQKKNQVDQLPCIKDILKCTKCYTFCQV